MKIPEVRIEEVKPRIFAVFLDDEYHLPMLFCRVQEFYESDSEEFRGKKFSIWRYMEWYSKARSGSFSYPSDWSGFNIPFETLEKCYDLHEEDETPYDGVMRWVIQEIRKRKGDDSLSYIIGLVTNDDDTTVLEHEICHGMYYIDTEYKSRADSITDELVGKHEKEFKKFRKNLLSMGYHEGVVKDELQAYLISSPLSGHFSKGVDAEVCWKIHELYREKMGLPLKD
jgi:hypothetical protein